MALHLNDSGLSITAPSSGHIGVVMLLNPPQASLVPAAAKFANIGVVMMLGVV